MYNEVIVPKRIAMKHKIRNVLIILLDSQMNSSISSFQVFNKYIIILFPYTNIYGLGIINLIRG